MELDATESVAAGKGTAHTRLIEDLGLIGLARDAPLIMLCVHLSGITRPVYLLPHDCLLPTPILHIFSLILC